ncbi:MAG: helix-turn-helix transcriptional regulator [Roseivirga sp.]|nr:helix-turn-helix transcriptional regulator [Roseivirga sp.]
MTVLEQRIIDHLLSELQASGLRFQERLKTQYPKLTAYDIRLCTYLKASLSTKEIALLLNITPDSVKKAKHRLRKKVGAPPEKAIQEYLQAQYLL